MRKCIESVLSWAYRHELPKGYHDDRERLGPRSTSISPMFKWAAHGGPVANRTRAPGSPLAMGTAPHPDAIAVHNAVMESFFEMNPRSGKPQVDKYGIVWSAAEPILLGDLARYVTADDVQE